MHYHKALLPTVKASGSFGCTRQFIVHCLGKSLVSLHYRRASCSVTLCGQPLPEKWYLCICETDGQVSRRKAQLSNGERIYSSPKLLSPIEDCQIERQTYIGSPFSYHYLFVGMWLLSKLRFLLSVPLPHEYPQRRKSENSVHLYPVTCQLLLFQFTLGADRNPLYQAP